MNDDTQAKSNLRGISFMLVSMMFFIVADALTKSAGKSLPVGEVIALRSAVAALVILPFLIGMDVLSRLPQLYSRPMVIRNIGEVGCSLLYVTTLVQVPIANATAIMQTSPLAITAAAALFLNEPVGWRRWSATVVGFLGALLIIRPASPDFSWWYLPAIIAVFFVVLRDLGTRQIHGSVPTLLVAFLTFVLTGIAAAFLGLTETWSMPSVKEAIKIALSGVLLIVGTSLLVISLRSGGEIAVIIPFRYSIVLWSILIGYFIWGELPALTSVIGILIVVGAGLYTVHREQVRRRQARQAGQ